MINRTLFLREMKNSLKLLGIFAAVLTLYVSIIVAMYDPSMAQLLDGLAAAMPELLAAFGMSAGATSLLGFLISYLYGFILLVFPMVFSILRANSLVARYVDRGSMVCLVAAPVKRRTVAATQMLVLLCGVSLLLAYTTGLEVICAEVLFPGELDLGGLLTLNGGLLVLHWCIGGICFLASCIFSDVKYTALVGAGIPALMYLFQMLSSVSQAGEKMKFFSLFTLYDPTGLVAREAGAFGGVFLLLVGALVLYSLSIAVFCRRDLPL